MRVPYTQGHLGPSPKPFQTRAGARLSQRTVITRAVTRCELRWGSSASKATVSEPSDQKRINASTLHPRAPRPLPKTVSNTRGRATFSENRHYTRVGTHYRRSGISQTNKTRILEQPLSLDLTCYGTDMRPTRTPCTHTRSQTN